MTMSLDAATRVILIRHGETDWNADTRIQGQLDIPLNARGREQAQRLADALAGETIDQIYASDLQRARATAEAVGATRGQPVLLERALRERAFGSFEGLSWAEIEERFPQDSARWRAREADFAPGGGERLADFYARSVSTVTRLAALHPGQSLVIVAHGGVLDCVYRAAQRLDLDAKRSWALGNACINRLLFTDEGFSLIGWNDDNHLGVA
ncbi:MAG TPA: histidine phosphatase family protein [Burkholderiaceae bacterium]